MASIFDTSDYREILKQYYQERKEEFPLYSYRMMGNKLDLDASQLFRILNKNQHLPTRCVPMAKEILGLTGRSAEYFEILIAAARNTNVKKRNELLEKAFQLQDVRRRQLQNKELELLSCWWHPVVRSLLEVTKGKADPQTISKKLRPNIDPQKVSESLDLLLDLGFVRKISSERLSLAEAHLTVSGPEKSKAVREFQKQIIDLGKASLDEVSVDQRDISTLTLAVDKDCFNDIKEMMREFRRQVQKRIEESADPDRIMQLNMSFFPVSYTDDKEEKK